MTKAMGVIYRMVRLLVALVLGGAALAVTTCSGAPPESCESGYGSEHYGVCIGVSTPTICEDTYCPAQKNFKQIIYVFAAAAANGNGSHAKPFRDLADAAKVAKGGACVLIGPGKYHGAQFDGAVSLLGAGAKVVTVVPEKTGEPVLLMSGGTGEGIIRGMTLEGGDFGLVLQKTPKTTVSQIRINKAKGAGLHAKGVTDIIVDHVTVKNTVLAKFGSSTEATGMGMVLASGTKGTLKYGLIANNTQLGLMVTDSDVGVVTSVVMENGSQKIKGTGGIVLHTSTPCKSTYSCTLNKVKLEKNRGVGIAVAGPKTVLKEVQIVSTTWGLGVAQGISVQKTATLTLEDSQVQGGIGQGIVIDGECGVGANPDPLIIKLRNNIVSGNKDRGIWLQNFSAPKTVLLENNSIRDNLTIGIGMTAVSGVKVQGGDITGTKLGPISTPKGSVDVGDGIQVLLGSSLNVEGVSFKKNGRLPLLFDSSGGVVKKNTFSQSASSVVAQNGSKQKVTSADNKDENGKAVGVTEPTQAYAKDSSTISLPSLPSTPPVK